MKTIKGAKPRKTASSDAVRRDVQEIINEVRANGDIALASFNERFDGCRRESVRVTKDEIEEAKEAISADDIADIKEAAANIRTFAEKQKACFAELPDFEIHKGAHLGHRVIPVGSVCCYVPGGSYPLFSTAMMLSIPARVAGCKRIIACSPVMKGTTQVHPMTLAALDICGVDEIYATGGAQAVAAAAYGTDSISPVDMIVGPGNSFVTEAKRQCYGQVGIDFIAGPTEVLVIADENARAKTVAADLLAQSEHDVIAKAIFITTDEGLARRVIDAVSEELKRLETAKIAGASWNDYGEVLLAEDMDEAIKYANDYAPEHLELCVADPKSIADRFRNYGSLFMGQNTAEVFGDYASGTNHTLPTMGAARYTGGVWVGTFLKVVTHQMFDEGAAADLAPLVSRLAEKEGLMAHKEAADARRRQKG